MITVDTHILAWYLEGNRKIPAWAYELIDASIVELLKTFTAIRLIVSSWQHQL